MNVLIVAEQHAGALRKATLNAVTAGRQLAEKTGGELSLALLGSGIGAAASELQAYGGRLHLLDAPELEHYLAEPYSEAVSALARRLGVTWIGAPATAFGKDLMPRVAARLEAGMASDVVGFQGEGEAVHLLRPMWAGNVLAEVEIATPVKVFTVRPTELAPAQRAESPAKVVAEALPALRRPHTRFLEMKPIRSGRPELTEARVVVAAGRGTKGRLESIEQLADTLGAAIGASRSAVDSGWVPNEYQIGQTGKVVAPELYIAVGISGAVQHVAGMKGSKVIVAINNNPDAPIFQVADYGLVADLNEAVPALRKEIEATR